jgi:hypothetical protein
MHNINPLKAQLNPICHLLTLLGAHHILHVSRIRVNCSWVATRWQLFSTHIHTNNTENDIKQTIHRTTQKYIEHKKYITTQKLGRVRAVPRLCGSYPGICLTTDDNNKNNNKLLEFLFRRLHHETHLSVLR